MKNFLLLAAAFIVVAGGWAFIRQQDADHDAVLCAIMEYNTKFDEETVDALRLWETIGSPSKRFNRLYEEKIRVLPGFRP